ncbi:MAG: CTP synthetase [Haloarculaceae archaeon]
MSQAVVVGGDEQEIGEALESAGFAVATARVGNRPGLEEAGVHDADLFVLTDLEQATSITVAHDLNEEVRIVVYAGGSLPDFATRQTDLMVDPDLLSPAAVAEELASHGE